ncbi:hypothetical protein [Streptomyces sp. NPDC047071]|uniref:hypothetical protein n=1 Tax=Streptomyces sp. NPDC047071 TaxID=3154808 RepID=UPI0034568551
MTTTSRQQTNTATELNFSGPHVKATLITHARDYAVHGTALAVNPQPRQVTIAEHPRKGIPPLSSTILRDTRIQQADTLILLRTDLDAPIGAITGEPGWQHLADLLPDEAAFPRTTPLFKSPQDDAGTARFDPAHLLGQTPAPARAQDFQIKVNLWFAPAGTDCHIHNRHDFIEVHTQVHGLGRMQKFTAPDPTRLYEDLRMSPGYTTPDPFCTIEADGSYHYPWHQYYADTDCVWLAVEYHRLTP